MVQCESRPVNLAVEAQSVFRTFFRRTLAGEFQIDSSEQLWQLLVRITVRKAQAQGRRHTAALRDVSAENPGPDGDAIARLADRKPGPEEAVILLDQIDVLLNNLPAMYCDVLDWRLQGHSATDIASRLGVSRRTVYRALELLGHRLEKMYPDRRRVRIAPRLPATHDLAPVSAKPGTDRLPLARIIAHERRSAARHCGKGE